MNTYYFNVPKIGKISVLSDSIEHAEQILQAYLDKHSLNYNFT